MLSLKWNFYAVMCITNTGKKLTDMFLLNDYKDFFEFISLMNEIF